MTRKCDEVQSFIVDGCYGEASPLSFKVYTHKSHLEVYDGRGSLVATIRKSQMRSFLVAATTAAAIAMEEAAEEAVNANRASRGCK